MNTKYFATALAGAFAQMGAQAHDGHGMAGAHWHATDAVGWVVAIALAVAGWYFGSRK
jgi:Co/Zn/Cd efflux system component